MGFQDAVRKCFSDYIVFAGRAPRSEFWWFMLFIFLGNIVFSALDALLFGRGTDGQSIGILGAIYSLAVFLPSIAVGIRRLHDVDRSGWWYLLILIPLLGVLILIIAFFIQKGTPGANRFGEDPLAGAGVSA